MAQHVEHFIDDQLNSVTKFSLFPFHTIGPDFQRSTGAELHNTAPETYITQSAIKEIPASIP